jgi:predicted transcriptional regulator
MKAITIKLSDEMLRQLQEEAKSTGRSVSAVIRERVQTSSDGNAESIYALTSDLAGTLAGVPKAATNNRRRFRKT